MSNNLWLGALKAGLAAHRPTVFEFPAETFSLYYATDTNALSIGLPEGAVWFTPTLQISEDYSGVDTSYQPVAVDLNLAAAAGSDEPADTAFLSPIMGNVLGDALTKTGNYLAGLIGKFSISGTVASLYPTGGVLGIIGDNGAASIPNGAVVAVLDGDGDRANASAAFATRSLNSTAGSGFKYGLDLKDDEAAGLGYGEVAISRAEVRMSSEVCIITVPGAPVDYTDGTPPATGEGYAEKGSLCVRIDTGKLYLNGGTKAQPLWKLVTSA